MRLKTLLEQKHKSIKSFQGYPFDDRYNGGFTCSNKYLSSLEGSPSKVTGFFACAFNELATLKYARKHVGGSFFCNNNLLVSLEFCPQFVGQNFSCYKNKIESLVGISDFVHEIRGYFDCEDNPIIKGGIDLLLVKGLKGIFTSNVALRIINEYVGKDDIYGCQAELIDKEYESYAEL